MNFGSSAAHRQKMKWQERYNVGHEALDRQHRKLLDLINDIRDLSEKGPSKEVSFSALNAMVKYAQAHFDTEEHQLEECDYPRLAQQKESHEQFMERVFSMAQDLEDEMLTMGSLTIYLEDWYIDHILGSDQEYKACIGQKNLNQVLSVS